MINLFAPPAQPAQPGPMLAQTQPSSMQQLAQLLAPTSYNTPQAQVPQMSLGEMARMMNEKKQQTPDSGLLGGATAGAPDWLNAVRFRLSGAGGVNPYTYGQGAVPGGTDTAGNYQV